MKYTNVELTLTIEIVKNTVKVFTSIVDLVNNEKRFSDKPSVS